MAGYGDDDALLNSYPMIMSHDAATGEIDERRDHIVAEWAQTQSVGLVQQLDCGSRSFDYRPFLTADGDLFAHHGAFVVRKPMGESIDEVKEWCHAHPDELVIFYITSCDKESDDDDSMSCNEAASALLHRKGIAQLSDCDELRSLTYSAAKEKAALGDGAGSLLAIIECTDSNYDDTNTCYGEGYICYDSWPHDTTQVPWQYMSDYLRNTTASDPSATSHNMWTTQALWQSTAYTVAAGILHNSSLLLDESRSGLNAWVLQAVKDGFFKYMNYLELNNVCNHGDEIRDALEEYYLQHHQ